jgi:ABC-2 type transport system permease protein
MSSGTLGYLLTRSFVNRLHVQLRRVRSPRYALAFLVGALYMWTFVFRGGRGGTPLPAGTTQLAPLLYEALLAILIAWSWLFGADEPALAFTAAEVQLLFPAPVSRRTLVRYKLAQAQVAILFSTLIWLALLMRSSPGVAGRRAIALWVLFTTLFLHRVATSFVRVSAAQHGRKGLQRNALPILLVGTAVTAVAWTVWQMAPALLMSIQAGAPGQAFLALHQAPVIRLVLWPFHALVAPVFAPTADAWARAMGWALLLLAAHYVWVMRAGVSFEEAAMQRAERIAAQRAARAARGGVRIRASRAWLPLRATGRPAAALIWKNTIAFQRTLAPSRWFIIIAVVSATVLSTTKAASVGWEAASAAALAVVVLLAMMGPLYVRTDLHQDMLMLATLRSYPLSGRTIVAAEMGGTLAVLSALQCVLLLIALPQFVMKSLPGQAVPLALATILALPAITALRVAVANAWVVLLPGWVQLGAVRSTGIESLGQNLLTIAGSLAVHLLLLALPAACAAAVAIPLLPWIHRWALVPAAAIGAVVAAGELWLIVRWLGGIFARTSIVFLILADRR